MQRLGIYGGTFDPPHIAHLILAAEALDQLALDKILWVLTPDPPHKRGKQISPCEQRLELLQAALAGETRFEVSRVDLERQPPHYALDTLNLLRQAYTGDSLVYLLGGDSLADLPKWHEPKLFVAACDEIGVMLRPGRRVDMEKLEQSLPGVREKVKFIRTPLLDVSSTVLRQKIAAGGAYRYYLPVAVYEMIRAKGYYRKPG